MAKTFLTSINLAGNELMNASVHNLAAAPSSPKIGQVYFNTGSKIPLFWDGTAWTMFGHTTAEINTIVRGTTLAGYTVGANNTLASGDTILSAFGKVQGQINAIPRGTVTSVGLSVPTGLSVTGSPIKGAGTLAISLATGYSIPTTAKQTNWDTAFTNNHTHANKGVIDKLTQKNLDVLDLLSIVDGNLRIDATAYSTGNLSAFGLEEEGGGSGGGAMNMMQTWSTSTETENYYLPAKLAVPFYNDTRSRLTTLEGGSATTVATTGTGNAITSVSKSGNTLTFNKATTFAELGADGFILTSQLPSYVDDVLEFATLANFPTTGESGKIYVATNTNLTYRWTGTTYVEISKSIALGTTSSTAYRGDRGKIAYEHSQVAHQTIINGTGFVKANGTVLSYDNKSYEVAFTKNTAFNKNFGTVAGTVTQGNDSRLSDARTPTKKTGVIGTGLTTVVTHGLGSADIIASVMTTAGEVVECDIINTATTTTFRFNVAPAASTYKYVIIG